MRLLAREVLDGLTGWTETWRRVVESGGDDEDGVGVLDDALDGAAATTPLAAPSRAMGSGHRRPPSGSSSRRSSGAGAGAGAAVFAGLASPATFDAAGSLALMGSDGSVMSPSAPSPAPTLHPLLFAADGDGGDYTPEPQPPMCAADVDAASPEPEARPQVSTSPILYFDVVVPCVEALRTIARVIFGTDGSK